MSKSNSKAAGAAERRKSSPKMAAGNCPTNKSHLHTEIYKTVGRTRFCKCNDCGATWKQVGPFSDELREYALELSESLKTAPRVKVGDLLVIQMEDAVAAQIAETLYTMATT